MTKPFVHPVRVYWEDTDAGGIVFYANYLKFMERARTEWLRSLGVQQQHLRKRTGGMFVVTETALKYRHPARLDDLLDVSAQVVDLGRASIKIHQEISLQPNEYERWQLSNRERLSAANDASPLAQPHALPHKVCEGTICIAWVDSASLKPGRIPHDVLEALT